MTLGQSSSNPNSPQKSPDSSAFQWPPVAAPSSSSSDISVKEIIDKYHPNNNELLKHALIAKSEEDKRLTAQDVLKTEQARLYLRQMDIELIKEQSKLAARQLPLHPVYASPQQQQQQQQQQPYAYYGLAPVQQQVLARITGGSSATPSKHHHQPPHTSIPHSQQQQQQQQQPYYQQPSSKEYGYYNQPPPSPGVYPHSAHPLCPPDNRLNPSVLPAPRHYQSQSHLLPTPSSQQPTTPISPGGGGNTNDDFKSRKRSHASILHEEDKLSHNKVMEALKAKIQRGSGSPLATTAPSSAFRPHGDKRQRTLPKPNTTTSSEVPPILTHPPQHHHHHHTPPPSTPSPRSAKPILPPIDTNVGRMPTKNLPSHPPPPLSPMKTSSPPHAAISSIRSSHAYNKDANPNHHPHNSSPCSSSSTTSPTHTANTNTSTTLPSISDHQK
ncbi:high-affinity iron permease [Mucor velutinosus]|uniref:High-affinity iron permease n=1 Tax=Mucor velutinosus TaxID=708070 RepID=A0AAN7HJK8_9FUNG|nr:high-affinity iron permease [Mucor velutinosus]